MKPPLSKAPASGPLLGLLAGILINHYASGATPLLWASVGCAVFLAVLLLWLRRHYLAFSCLFCAVGALSFAATTPPAPPSSVLDGLPHEIQGEITDCSRSGVSQTLTLQISTIDARAISPRINALITVGDIEPQFSAGDKVEIKCSLSGIASGYVPEGMGPGQDYYFARGISARAFCPSNEIRIVGRSSSLSYLPSRLRERIADAIVLSPLNAGAQDFLLTSVLGMRGETPPEMSRNFRALGISHILCVSGYHVGLVAALVGLLLFPLRAIGRRARLRHIVAVLLVWLYVAVCGAQVSAVRAGIMISVFLLARMVERGNYPWNSLFLAAFIILVVRPYYLFDGGFLLSFSAVAGLLIFADRLNPVPRRRNTPYRLVNLITLPLAAVLGTLPVSLGLFHYLPLYFLPANIIVALLFPLFLILAGACMFLWHAGLHFTWLALPADTLFDAFSSFCTHLGDSAPLWSDVHLSTIGTAFLTAAILAFAWSIGRRRALSARLSALLCSSLMLVGAFVFSKPSHEPWAILAVERRSVAVIYRSADRGGVFMMNPGQTPERDYSPILKACGVDSVLVHNGGRPAIDSPGIFNSPRGLLIIGSRNIVYDSIGLKSGSLRFFIHRGFLPSVQTIAERAPKQVYIAGNVSEHRRRLYTDSLAARKIPCLIIPVGSYIEM